MKTLFPAAIRCSLMFTAVAAFSIVYSTSVQAVPTTYQYTGNPFTFVDGSYTTSDFVSGMVTLAGPLAPNMALTSVSPTAFTFSDGVQTFTNLTPSVDFSFAFATGPTGAITLWNVNVETSAQSNLLTVRDGINDPPTLGRTPLTTEGGTFPLQGGGLRCRRGPSRRLAHPIIDDADPYGVGCSGPPVQAGGGLTALGLAQVASCRFANRAGF